MRLPLSFFSVSLPRSLRHPPGAFGAGCRRVPHLRHQALRGHAGRQPRHRRQDQGGKEDGEIWAGETERYVNILVECWLSAVRFLVVFTCWALLNGNVQP